MIMARWALLTSIGLVYVSRLQKYDKSELKKMHKPAILTRGKANIPALFAVMAAL